MFFCAYAMRRIDAFSLKVRTLLFLIMDQIAMWTHE
jgi:hypothetical protein